jgi:hypothetical protein
MVCIATNSVVLASSYGIRHSSVHLACSSARRLHGDCRNCECWSSVWWHIWRYLLLGRDLVLEPEPTAEDHDSLTLFSQMLRAQGRHFDRTLLPLYYLLLAFDDVTWDDVHPELIRRCDRSLSTMVRLFGQGPTEVLYHRRVCTISIQLWYRLLLHLRTSRTTRFQRSMDDAASGASTMASIVRSFSAVPLNKRAKHLM